MAKSTYISENTTQNQIDIFGKLFGDKGYISKELTKILFVDGIHLITSIRNNI